MKQNLKNLNIFSGTTGGERAGFTLIELLIVISIMGLMAGMVIANFSGGRSARNLRIATNEMVTNFRKTQSYALASHNLAGAIPVQYYILKIDTANPSQYVIQGMYNVKTTPAQLRNAEVIYLPKGVKISAISIGSNVGNFTPSCALVAFRLPFANILASSQCVGSPPDVLLTDDYQKIINYVINNNNSTVYNDSKIVVTLAAETDNLTSKILINGITGVICPTGDGIICAASY